MLRARFASEYWAPLKVFVCPPTDDTSYMGLVLVTSTMWSCWCPAICACRKYDMFLIASVWVVAAVIPYTCGISNLVGMYRVVHPGMLLASIVCSADVDENGLLL